MNVVLYLRYSSSSQTEQSIEGQNRVCTDFCNREGYSIVGKYIDRATSAFKDTDKRTEFQRMMKDSEKGSFEAVIVYKLDRFARNRYDSATYKTRLKKNGCKVISATENISDNPEGVILESVLEGMAEFYSLELSQKIRRGMYESAQKCYSIGGCVPLGYRIENKKLVINEQTAHIVKEAFEEFAEGASYAQLIELFNSKGYRTSKGKEFNKNSFHCMFRNERYYGAYKFKGTVVENGNPAIISKELYDKAQARLKVNRSQPGKYKTDVDYLLTGKLFCGHCGNKMVGDSGTGKSGKLYHYYICVAKKREHSCNKAKIRQKEIEDAVFEDALEALTPENIDAIADAAVKASEEDAKNNSEANQAEQELKEVETAIANLTKSVEMGVISDTIIGRISELEKQKKGIEKRITEAKKDTVVLEKEHIVWFLSQFTQGNADDPKFRKRIINLLINKVVVWDLPDGGWKARITYNLDESSSEISADVSTDNSCSDDALCSPPLIDSPFTVGLFLI